MVHNGIEYGIMQAYAEGYELMAAVAAARQRDRDVQVLAAGHGDPVLAARPGWCWRWSRTRAWSKIRGYAADSGEGRWTVEAAIDNAVPMPVITAALFARFASRQDDSPAMKMVAALRNQFGGHAVEGGRHRPRQRRHLARQLTSRPLEPCRDHDVRRST